MRVPRSRGALSGLLLIVLGVWGALVPFIGPYFNYSYTPDTSWAWTWGRFWLEVLPGIATIFGGFLMMTTANRAIAVFGGYLASAAGAWFVVGPILGQLWGGEAGATGTPVGGQVARVVEQIGFFYGLGAAILFLAAQAVGRFTVRSVRDVEAVQKHRDTATELPPVIDVRTAAPVQERPADSRGATAVGTSDSIEQQDQTRHR